MQLSKHTMHLMRSFKVRALALPALAACAALAAPLAASAQQADVVFSHQFESGAVSLSPDLVDARAGSTTTGIAGPLLLQLDEPVAANTFVPIVSLNPARLSISSCIVPCPATKPPLVQMIALRPSLIGVVARAILCSRDFP